MDVTASDDEQHESQLQRVMQELADADPDEIEDQTYRSFRFDVCDACRRGLLAKPLG